MGDVIQVDTVTCMGMRKEEFKTLYFMLRPRDTDENFERAWAEYTLDKAKHIAELNNA
jgi:hypothetical protein